MTPVAKSCKTTQLFHYVFAIVLLFFAGYNTSVNLCSNKIYIIGVIFSLFSVAAVCIGNISVA